MEVENKIQIDKDSLAPEDFENTKFITLDDGSQQEVYISRAGNIVTPPKDRYLSRIDGDRRQLCWDLYVKSLRTGFPSARQAALDAGFAPNSAINIRNQRWFKDKLKHLSRASMVSKAERNLNRALNQSYSKMKILEDGSEEEVIDKDIFKTVIDVSKYITSTLAKDEGYSTKTEVKGDMSGEIKINSINYSDQIEEKVADNIIDITENKILEEVIKEE